MNYILKFGFYNRSEWFNAYEEKFIKSLRGNIKENDYGIKKEKVVIATIFQFASKMLDTKTYISYKTV